ncbi:MAG: hypothetical protein NZM31_14240 [Gemmatales bacterium]|nr:hypothetical protein [Gemmatales bacterium]MDW8388155.1 hypothetical protein [Gemmatales bacterium]
MVSAIAEYTLAELILLAAKKLQDQGQSPFSAEDLIVASWRENPKAFGLKGYAEQYPDSNRVLASIMGERGLARKGWLAKMGQKLYTLSPEGQRVVKRLLEGDGEDEEEAQEQAHAQRLPREQEKVLIHLLDSSARRKMDEGKAYELSFADACRFWSITDNLSADALDAQLNKVESVLSHGERAAAKGPILIGHREVTRSDMETLRNCHEYLQERFERHLMLLRSRAK